jgi:protein-L-isoaspartate(D-aspartate) O-methyltransferase
MLQTDTYKHKGMRAAMIETIRKKGLNDDKVLAAILKVPRHFFLDSAFLEHAYQDKAFSIGEGQTISQPYTVAYQSSLLQINPGDKVLEIGTGSGYQTCILAELGAQVFTIEYNRILFQRAKKLIKDLHYKVTAVCGDGSLGLPASAPFQRILVTAGAPAVPDALVAQLDIGGRMVIPVGDRQQQTMTLVIKEAQGIHQQNLHTFCFVPLLGRQGWEKA